MCVCACRPSIPTGSPTIPTGGRAGQAGGGWYKQDRANPPAEPLRGPQRRGRRADYEAGTYQPPPETQKKEPMWSLPFNVFSLAGEEHIQVLNDTGIVLEPRGPQGVNSILNMLPTTCGGSGLDQGMDDVLPALSDPGGKTKR